MAHTPRIRDRFRLLTSAVTGVTAVGVVAAVGATTGLAAEQTAQRDAARQQPIGADGSGAAARTSPRSDRPITVWRQRRHRTVVSTRVVVAAGGPAAVALGGAAPDVHVPPGDTSSANQSGGSGQSPIEPAPSQPPPPPDPVSPPTSTPTPAPSSGS